MSSHDASKGLASVAGAKDCRVRIPGTDLACECPLTRGFHEHPNGIYKSASYHSQSKKALKNAAKKSKEKFRGKSPGLKDGQLATDFGQRFG